MYAMKYTLKTSAKNIVNWLTTETVSNKCNKKLAKTNIANNPVENNGFLKIKQIPLNIAFIGLHPFWKYRAGIEYKVRKKYKIFPALIKAILLKIKILTSSGSISKNFTTSICPPEIAPTVLKISLGFPIIKSASLKSPKAYKENRKI